MSPLRPASHQPNLPKNQCLTQRNEGVCLKSIAIGVE